MQENEDLRKEVTAFKGITHDQRMEKLVTENDYLHQRVGELLKEVHDLETKNQELQTVAP